MGKSAYYALLLILVGSCIAGAKENTTEVEAREIEQLLISPCCGRQQVAVHHSEAAEKIKQEIRQMLTEGKTREQILAHYAAIYGEQVLAVPANKGFNRMAYLFPLFALVTGAGIIFLTLRRWRGKHTERTSSQGADRSPAQPDDVSPAKRSRIERELQELD